MFVAIDFGITNTDVVVNQNDGDIFYSFPSRSITTDFIDYIFDEIDLDIVNLHKIGVTGGKSSNLSDTYRDIPIIKINEVDAIGLGAIALYDISDESFVAVSTGTGTACIHHSDGKFNHLGGISVGGGTLRGLSQFLISTESAKDIEELAIKGDRKELDFLIGDVVNEIGSLYPEITASNFGKVKNNVNNSKEDTAASLSNMIGEVIGTISYLNALLCNENKVYFLGRTSLNKLIKTGIEDRLKLANINGVFKENREYGNVLGALKSIQSD
ncbi:pantothenate kinase [Gammaproteobacteria bacterium]|nr:pantothenate kinase [Gammaproteobacteria bacterium]